MIATVLTAAPIGFDGVLVHVETDMKQGLPGIQIVGMGGKAVTEARERVRSALKQSLLTFPARKFTISLAPAELPKEGALYDLPIALSILIASGQLGQREVATSLFAGELALDGHLRPIRGAISVVETARQAGCRMVFLPLENAPQAALVPDIEVIGVTSLHDLFLHLKAIRPLPALTASRPAIPLPSPSSPIIGQEHAKRALMIAAAGKHNLLLIGPPGTGKSLLAHSLIHLLPPLSAEESLSVMKLHGLMTTQPVTSSAPPFRSPHHSASRTALIGGGSPPLPGDISLAHHGVLLLDELPEYPRSVLESLRQPLEDGRISLSRVGGRVEYPARFILIATMNPCPCGYLGSDERDCRCTPGAIEVYRRRVSGPLLDRFDMVVRVVKVSEQELSSAKLLNITQRSKVLNEIENALNRQNERYNSSSIYNAYAYPLERLDRSDLSTEAQALLVRASEKLALSTRGYFKVLKIARTIADLADTPVISAEHVAEALQLRTDGLT